MIEVLLAMALTGLVVALVGPLTLQVAETRKVAHVRIAKQDRRALLEQLIAEDFERLLSVDWKHTVPLTVVGGSTLCFELPVLATIPNQSQSLHSVVHPCLVRYWKRQKDHERFDLERELIDLTQPSNFFPREPVATNLASFELRARRRREWASASTITAAELKNIEAIRLEIAWSDGNHWSRTVGVNYVR